VEPVEVAVTDEAGESRALSVSASPIRTRQGVVLGAVATFRDNTELRRLEEVLRRRERLAALGEMAAQLAHEIRNPLGGIDLYASLLFRALEDQPSEQDLARKVATATSSLNRLVEDMLTFTRPAELKRAKVRCGDLLDGAVELAGQTVAEQEVQVRRRYNESAPVWLDPDLMQRAFLNVILNAAQMTPAGGVLELATEVRGRGAGPEPATLVARIADAGPGVPAAMRDKIFNPFFTTRDGGTGLGLAIVHKIVQEHGGTVTVEDNEPTGAAFVFELPVETG
jgi:signal transduction histidine kinase